MKRFNISIEGDITRKEISGMLFHQGIDVMNIEEVPLCIHCGQTSDEAILCPVSEGHEWSEVEE
jgi:hypothetical protein